MNIPFHLAAIPTWTAIELDRLPTAEDERHEYKSSRILPADLKRELGIAASGFLNAGGGLIVVGVDGSGRSDGGIDQVVGRQPLRDWVDQCLAEVSPTFDYSVCTITDTTLSLNPQRCILVVGFGESHLAPHMAPDRRYYVRAGAHTVPASHFLVEALMSRRGLSHPSLRLVLRVKPGARGVVQLGIVAVSAAAVDVTITLPPLRWLSTTQKTTIDVGIITQSTPFFFDFHRLMMNPAPLSFEIQIKYHDISGRTFNITSLVDTEKQLGPNLGSDDAESRQILRVLEGMQQSLEAIAHSKSGI